MFEILLLTALLTGLPKQCGLWWREPPPAFKEDSIFAVHWTHWFDGEFPSQVHARYTNSSTLNQVNYIAQTDDCAEYAKQRHA
jgi:hypothetical protein